MNPGVLVALAAYFFFCICDAFIKAIGPETSVFQTLFFVTLFSFIPVLAFTLRHDPLSAMFKMSQPWLVMGRAATGILAGMFGFYTFTHLPFAEAYALIFLAPVFVTVLSIFFLGEQVRAWRWTAVAVGLFGVWVVVRQCRPRAWSRAIPRRPCQTTREPQGSLLPAPHGQTEARWPKPMAAKRQGKAEQRAGV